MFQSRLVPVVTYVLWSVAIMTPASWAAAQSARGDQAEIKTIAVHGTTLHYSARGHGPLVVLVHGSLGELSDWDADAKVLGARFRVIAYSRRFHEPNVPPRLGEPYSMRQHAEDLATLIRANDGKAIVVAHSYGAYTSLYMAVHHPELVRALVLAEPPILPWLKESPEGRVALQQFQEAALTPAREAFRRGDMGDGMRRFINGVSGRPIFDQLPEQARADLMRSAPEMRAEMTTDPDQYMPALSCSKVHRFNRPVLIVTGENSPTFFHLIVRRLQSCLPRAEIVSIKGVSHGTMLAPPAFTSVVQDFLSRHK